MLNVRDYDGVINYFKDTLNNVERLQIPYIYYLAFACLMKNDYEHAVALAEDILQFNVISPQSFMVFVNVFLGQQHFNEAFTILDKILGRVSTVDNRIKSELLALVKENSDNFSYEKYPHISKLIELSTAE